jgi:hypothetical protein
MPMPALATASSRVDASTDDTYNTHTRTRDVTSLKLPSQHGCPAGLCLTSLVTGGRTARSARGIGATVTGTERTALRLPHRYSAISGTTITCTQRAQGQGERGEERMGVTVRIES